MIDPINPGPAGTAGPAGTPYTGLTATFVADALAAAGGTLSSATAAVLGIVSQALEAANATINQSIGKLATAAATPLGNAQTTADLAAARVTGVAGSQIASASTAGAPVYTADQGGPNYSTGWNLWSARVPTGWSKPIPEQYFTNYQNDLSHCFRGWAAVYADALSLADSLPELPPNACPQPSVVINPPTGGTGGPDCPGGLYQVWQQVVGSDIIGCQLLCADSPGPSGGVRVGNPVSLDIAQGLMQTIACTGTPTGGGGGTQWYAGCVSGKPVTWSSSDQTPSGVSNQVGPFGDQASAVAAAPSCTSGGNGGTGGTGGTGTTQCCDTTVTKLPDCIYLDLCDWEKFRTAMRWAIYKGLCDFIQDPQCQCPTQDSDRWRFEDCDGQFATGVDEWFGNAGRAFANGTGVDQFVGTATSALGGLGDGGDVSPSPWTP